MAELHPILLSLTFDHDRCAELRARIQQITDGEYATAKRDVDSLRAELGQPPLPGLQATLEEKSQQYATSLKSHMVVALLDSFSLTMSSYGLSRTLSGICRSVALAPIRTTSVRQTRRPPSRVFTFRGRVESDRGGDRKEARIVSGRHLAVMARRPRQFRRKCYSNILRNGRRISDVTAGRHTATGTGQTRRLSIGELLYCT